MGETASQTKYTVSTKEVLNQAHIIAGKIEIPQTMRNVLQRAICARKGCADLFQSSKVESQDSNEGHQHFIQVLEQILSILDHNSEIVALTVRMLHLEPPEIQTTENPPGTKSPIVSKILISKIVWMRRMKKLVPILTLTRQSLAN